MIDVDALIERQTTRPGKNPRFGWIVLVVGKGRDKSNYWVVPVLEPGGYTGDTLTLRNGRTIPRNGRTVHEYRQQARQEKKTRRGWTTNLGSWANQADIDGYY